MTGLLWIPTVWLCAWPTAAAKHSCSLLWPSYERLMGWSHPTFCLVTLRTSIKFCPKGKQSDCCSFHSPRCAQHSTASRTFSISSVLINILWHIAAPMWTNGAANLNAGRSGGQSPACHRRFDPRLVQEGFIVAPSGTAPVAFTALSASVHQCSILHTLVIDSVTGKTKKENEVMSVMQHSVRPTSPVAPQNYAQYDTAQQNLRLLATEQSERESWAFV